jgi:hypothetical protein
MPKHCVDNDTSPVPKRVTCRGSKGLKPVAEDIGRCVVVVSPDAGIFYSMHEQLGRATTSQNPTQHAAAPPMQEAGNYSTTETSVRMSHNTTARVVSDKATSRPFLPMDISWLRICRDSPPVGRPGSMIQNLIRGSVMVATLNLFIPRQERTAPMHCLGRGKL